ncbi:glycerol-3-phosphate responsive antiterminator [Marinicrinis lubricantis]|uniref:Glycerol uptake operon antiterminator regulatory protein n=1 Tax=Marinicrinis lubricantis TaxID=2086470 RepID=A0ABW1INP3_9BACL
MIQPSIVIASITHDEQLSEARISRVKRVNLMAGNINTLQSIIHSLHQADKQVYVHIDMVQGIGRDASFIQYLAEHFKPDGIITTKSQAISAAKLAGLKTIQRFFAIDSSAIETAIKMIQSSQPHEVEIMPGLMPRIIQETKERISCPLIVGGLIRSNEEIEQALTSGADYVSIGDERFW